MCKTSMQITSSWQTISEFPFLNSALSTSPANVTATLGCCKLNWLPKI